MNNKINNGLIKKPLNKFKKLLDHMTENELIMANRMIVERINLVRKTKSLHQMSKFSIGDMVSFENDNQVITGIIIKLNQKTVSVHTQEGIRWNVSPSFLQKIER